MQCLLTFMTLCLVSSVQRVRVCTLLAQWQGCDVCVDSILFVQMGSLGGSSEFHIQCCMQSEGFIDACVNKDSLQMHLKPPLCFTFCAHIVNCLCCWGCFQSRISRSSCWSFSFNVPEVKTNPLLCYRLCFALRVTVSLGASLLCASSVKCAPLWEESLWRNILRWGLQYAASRHLWSLDFFF